MNLNKRISKKHLTREIGFTKPQLKVIKGLMNTDKFKEFKKNWYWWDYGYIVDLLYYTQDDNQVTLEQLGELEDSLNGVGYVKPGMSIHEIENVLWEKSQPYYDLVSQLNRKSAYLYGIILKYMARAYNAHGVAEEAHKTAKELIKAGNMLENYQLDAYINYAQEGFRLNGWWD